MSIQFLIDGADLCAMGEFLKANADDEDVCEWARTAKPGDTYPSILPVQAVEVLCDLDVLVANYVAACECSRDGRPWTCFAGTPRLEDLHPATRGL